MGVAEQSSLIVTIRLNDQMTATSVKVGKSVADLERKTISLRRATSRLGEGMRTGLANGAKVAAVGIGLLAYNIRQGITELVEWEDAQLQISAALKSTNQAAGVTAAQTEKLAQKYAELSNYEDDVVLSAEAVLLRFPNIKKKAFEPTLKAATDLAAGMGRDLPSATRSLALALNNPTVGLSRLTRQGLSFTDQQQKQIKALVESGKLQKAQAIILERVNKVYGGSATKATEGYRGSMIKLDKAVKGLQQSLAEPLIKPLTNLIRRLTKFAQSDEVQQGLKDLGTGIAGLFSDANLDKGFQALKDGFGFIEDLDWSAIQAGVNSAATVLGAAIKTFTSLPAPVQGALMSFLAVNKFTGGLGTAAVKGLGELLVTGLKTINAVNVTVVGANVTQGGVPGGGGAGAPVGAGRAGIGVGAAVVGLGAAWLLNNMFNDPSHKGDLGAPLGGELGTGSLGMTNWDAIQVKLTMERERLSRLVESMGIGFGRSGFATGGTGGAGGKTAPGLIGQASPGTAARSQLDRAAAMIVKFVDQGRISTGKGAKIYEALVQGNMTYKEALKELGVIGGNTARTEQAVKGQTTTVTVRPSVTISATATGNSISFASGVRRIIIR